jgi:hypothetical protein
MSESQKLESKGMQLTLSSEQVAACPRGPVVDGDNTVKWGNLLFWFTPQGSDFVLDECPEGCDEPGAWPEASDSDDDEWRREIAREEGMLGGCDAYNEVMGY